MFFVKQQRLHDSWLCSICASDCGPAAVVAWLTAVFRDLNGMGFTVVLTLVTLATEGYLALVNARAVVIVVLCAVGSGDVLVTVFKAT